MSGQSTELMVVVFGDESQELDLGEEPIKGEFYVFDGMGHVNAFISERGAYPHPNPDLAAKNFLQLRDGRAALLIRGRRLELSFKVNAR